MLTRVGFSTGDEKVFVDALDGVREQLDSLKDSASASSQEIAAAQGSRRQILDDALSRIKSRLSMDGLTKVATYVQGDIKSHIVIYGSLPQ